MNTAYRLRQARRSRRILFGILLLAALLRIITLLSVELDRDEIWSLHQSRDNLTAEINHTFHLLAVAPLTRNLPDTIGIRILSYWMGLIAVAASARLGFRVGGWRLALIVAFLVAISPYLVAYSQEGRDYMLCTALATLGLVLWLERRVWLSTVFLALGILALSSSILLVVGIDVATGLSWLRRRTMPNRIPMRAWIVSRIIIYGVAIGLSWLVAHSPAGAYLPVTYNMPVTKVVVRYAGLMQCGDGTSLPCLSLSAVLWPVLIIGIVLLALRRRLPYSGLVMLMVAFLPLLALMILHAANYGIFVHRHIIMALPALLCLFGLVIMYWRRLGAPLLTLLAVQAALGLALYYQDNPYKPNWNQIVAYVDTQRAPSEPVIAGPVLLNMLADEATYHFGRTIPSTLPSSKPYWFITLDPAQAASDCTEVQGVHIREVFLFHCP